MNLFREAADLLHGAQTSRAPIAPLTERYPGLDVADAYAIEKVNLTRRLDDGRSLVGHKIGLTSEPMQTLLGVDEPDFGYILDDMVLRNGSAAPTARASLWLNGNEVHAGVGSAVMGNPAAAVAWLANALGPLGTEIVTGQFVMSGSFTSAVFVHPGDHASTTISGLGTVSLSFT